MGPAKAAAVVLVPVGLVILLLAGAMWFLHRGKYRRTGGLLALATALPGAFGKLAGAEVLETPWPRAGFPVEEVVDLVDERTGVIAVVTPNNPTGLAADRAAVARLGDRPDLELHG